MTATSLQHAAYIFTLGKVKVQGRPIAELELTIFGHKNIVW